MCELSAKQHGEAVAKTSIKQVPALHKWAAKELFSGKRILDYGCGKYTLGEEYLASYGHKVDSWDKYHRDVEIHPIGTYDVVLCANVLNVCTEQERMSIYEDLKAANRVYFSVYEGNRSGKIKGVQQNKKVVDYLPELELYFNYVERKGNKLICWN